MIDWLTVFQQAFPQDERVVVPGEGPEHAALMLIGEAPGKQEAEQRRPFVGKAGQNLNEFLQAIGLDREQIRVTNTVKVRPTRVSPKGTVANRPPNRQELEFFIPLLHQEIVESAPALLVTLGNTPLQAICGKDTVIGAVHGRLLMAKVCGQDFRVFPLYHPAAIIYNRSLQEVYQQDLQELAALLKEDAHE